jgi:glycerophosphoryl diester phosphodiesterase
MNRFVNRSVVFGVALEMLALAARADHVHAQSDADERSNSIVGSPVQRISSTDQTRETPSPLVIAHRGASGYLPEHTLASTAFAHAVGSDYIEQDVVLSADGHAVVLHDVTLNRTTDVAEVFPDRHRDGSYFVFDFTLEELRRLNVHERFQSPRPRFPQQSGRFRITTLREQIELIQGLNHTRGTNVGLYVEIKRPALHRMEGLDPSPVVLQILRDYGYRTRDHRAYVQCFEADEILRLRTELKCQLSLIQLLSERPTDEQLAEIAKVADGIGVSLSAVIEADDAEQPHTTNLVREAHQHALQVHAWTVRADDLPMYAASMNDLLNLLVVDAGVDGIFADHPDLAIRWRQQNGRSKPAQGPFHLLQNRQQREP